MILDFSAETIPYMSIITSILFLVSLTFFGWLSIKSRSIRTFQFQISLFIGLYVIGELLEIKQVTTLLNIPDALGSQIHVAATIFLTVVIWMRLYYSEKGIKSLADAPSDNRTKT